MSMSSTNHRLVLASASPRRRELFGWFDLPFEVQAAAIDETVWAGESPVAAVRRFAREKAEAGAGRLSAGESGVIVAADTIVVLDGVVYGKPRDVADATDILCRLRGRTHQVYTAVVLLTHPGLVRLESLACTMVPIRHYSDWEVEQYVRSGDPFDKAGAYAVQNPTFRPAEALHGCYANVMGLPLCHLMTLWWELGIRPPVQISAVCQAKLSFLCSVHTAILGGVLEPCRPEVAPAADFKLETAI
jgi:MAF protein